MPVCVCVYFVCVRACVRACVCVCVRACYEVSECVLFLLNFYFMLLPVVTIRGCVRAMTVKLFS